MGVLATCLFYGDAMITPAVTMLPAIEGLAVVEPAVQPLILPITIAILIGLFVVQRRGTGTVGGDVVHSCGCGLHARKDSMCIARAPV
jgi:KUP system potassium uptake protein